MTVSTSANNVVYRGNGAATSFAVPFKVLDEDHLRVRRRVYATGAYEHTYVGTDYSYAGIGNSSGTLTLAGTALDDDYELVIERIVPYTQDLDIVNAGGFYPDTVEEQLDLITMGLQQVADIAERSAIVPVGENGLEITSAADRAGTFFAFDALGAFTTSSGTGNDSALRTDLAATAGSTLVGHGETSVAAALPENPLKHGAVGDGVANDTAAVALALATGKDVYIPSGYTFAITNLTGFVNNQRIFGGGCFKKYGTDINGLTGQMLRLPDESEGIWFDGIEFDGNKDAFDYGDPVPAILGYLVKSLIVTNCYFHDIIDAGIKLRDSAGLYAAGNRFINTMENGIELHHYGTDPRTGLAYTGTRPTVQGNHTIIGNDFKEITRIEDGALVDACGIALLAGAGSQRHYNVRIIGNHFEDCLRGIAHETNAAGLEGFGIVIEANTFHNGVSGGTAEGIYSKVSIQLVSVINAVIASNFIRNPGNHELADPASITTAGIYVSASAGITNSTDILILNNSIVDDSGLANRTEYGIFVLVGQRITIKGNTGSGARTAFIGYQAVTATNIICEDNPGGALDQTWSDVVSVRFSLTDLAATANADMLVGGFAGMDDWIFPAPGRIVGMSARLSATQVAGTVTIKAYIELVEQAGVQVLMDVAAAGRGTSRVSNLATAQAAVGDSLSIKAVSDSLNPAGSIDVLVDALIEFGVKQ